MRSARAWLNPIGHHLIEERANRFLVGQLNAAREPQVQNVLVSFVFASDELDRCHGPVISNCRICPTVPPVAAVPTKASVVPFAVADGGRADVSAHLS
jgi:hypothetical protein